MKKIKKIVMTVLTLVLISALTACSTKQNTTEDTSNDTVTQTPAKDTTSTQNDNEDSNEENRNSENLNLSGTVTITGSTSVEKILNDMIDEFCALNPDVTIHYTGTGSSAGISDTISGVNDIGASSREVKEEEKKNGLKEVTFAYDGIAVVVNPANTVENISTEDLAKVYSGEITNWKQLGGKDAEIIVVSREGASGTRSAFEELVGLEEAGGLTENATVVEGNGNVQTNVAGNENAIGYVSFSYIDDTVKSLKVNGVEATAENAKSGDYSLSRPFLFVYMEDHASDATKAFIEFSISDDGQVFVEEHGGIKIK